MELAGRDISFEDMFRLCDEQDLRRAKKPAMGEVSGTGEKLAGGEDGRPSSYSSEEAAVELLRVLQATPMTFETLEASKIGKTISGLRKHSSEKVRGLAAALYKNWKALVDEHLTKSSSKPPAPAKIALAASDHAKKADIAASHKPAPAPATKKTASNKHKEAPAHVDEAKLAAVKRKLQESYNEAASAKKQRMIQVIDTPKKVNRRPVAVVERRCITPAVATVAPLRRSRAA
uniref:TFIIS N-terminal domain-containing protein n=1 Tax=Oryza punctata TaxID=4537 RepID=A0A0E0M620_ORYPU